LDAGDMTNDVRRRAGPGPIKELADWLGSDIKTGLVSGQERRDRLLRAFIDAHSDGADEVSDRCRGKAEPDVCSERLSVVRLGFSG
jgi:hypothetical protein